MLFGFKNEHKFRSVLNYLLLQARFLIFRCKVDKQSPNYAYVFLLIKNVNVKRTIWLKGYHHNGNHKEPSEQRLQEISIAKY